MFDFFEYQNRLVLVLEHVEGTDLDRVLQQLSRRKQQLSDGAIWYLGHQVAGALAHAHASIWEGRSWGNTLKFWFDGLIYACLTAGVFGWRWPK